MRIAILLLFAFVLQAGANGLYSQSAKVSLDMQNTTVEEILNAIEKESEFYFLYNSKLIDVDRKVSVNVKSQPVEIVLDKLFAETDVIYKVEDRQIILSKKDFVETAEAGKTMQQAKKQISGTVVDDTGEPIIGANVVEKGTTNGVITDVDGSFTLSIEENAILQVSYIGYTMQEVLIRNQATIQIVMKEDLKALDEIIVVGFGTQKKVNLTGSVGVATAKDIESRPVMLATQALQGLVPGLNITQNNGGLDSRASINVRGVGSIATNADGTAFTSSSPLVLIDGMEGDIDAINPQDIESISVLKDASASSIYGSRAPFGVILITTKNGSKGKTVIRYSNSFRWSKPISIPTFMDSYSFATYFNDAALNAGQAAHFGDAWLANILAYQKGEITTSTVVDGRGNGRWEEGFDPRGENNTGGNDNRNYFKEFYRKNSMAQDHNISLSGGTDKATYYTSFNYLHQDGLMVYNQDKYDRFAATVKLGYDATEWLRINYSNRFIREKFRKPVDLTEYFYDYIGGQGWPVLPLYDPNGHLLNRWAISLRDGGEYRTEKDNLYQQIQGILEPIKNWKTFVEFNYSIMNYGIHTDNQTTYMYDVEGNPFVWSDYSAVTEESQKENRTGLNLYTEYAFAVNDKHNLKGMAGLQLEKMHQTIHGGGNQGIKLPGINEIDATSGTDYWGGKVDPWVYGRRNEWSTLGYFARINYDYASRYLIEMNVRNDGSSRFREDSRWVLSPSFSVGWNVAQEDFWNSLESLINTFKIRASYGQLANQNTYDWYPTYAVMGMSTANGTWLQEGQKPSMAWAPTTLTNDKLTWEKVRTTNIGVDFGLLNNRLVGSFDYFVRQTKDMLGPAPERPDILGVAVPRENNTDMTSRGFELQLEWRDRLKSGLGYGVKFTLSDYRTKIDKYPNLTGNLGLYREGQYLGEIWGYETVGIAKTQEEMDAHLATLPNGGQNALGSSWQAGDIMYADLNGDGKINTGDYTEKNPGDWKIIGNSTPRYQFGIDVSADWKGFDFKAFFQGVMKRDYWQGSTYMFGATHGLWWSAAFTDHMDYFRDASTPSVQKGVFTENHDSYYPRALFNTKNVQVQSKYLQDASYIRLKNLQIGYSLPSSVVNKIGIGRIRVFVAGENLWTLTGVRSMFDPETISGGRNNNGSVYPLLAVYSFGLNINF
ncbi:MAG: TonB-dependent receptor [Tannerella sp.]|nr:TonB-dependent receptor [Tannerella sp.]